MYGGQLCGVWQVYGCLMKFRGYSSAEKQENWKPYEYQLLRKEDTVNSYGNLMSGQCSANV